MSVEGDPDEYRAGSAACERVLQALVQALGVEAPHVVFEAGTPCAPARRRTPADKRAARRLRAEVAIRYTATVPAGTDISAASEKVRCPASSLQVGMHPILVCTVPCIKTILVIILYYVCNAIVSVDYLNCRKASESCYQY